MKFNNITLIGMPGSGKSVRGKLLAEKLNFKFIDGDKYIEQKEKMRLQQIIDRDGDKGFLKIEEKRILELIPLRKIVLSPGGSIIYSEKIMNALKKSSFIVFLDESLRVIEKRLTDNKETRGIVGLKSKSVKELYNERAPLYKKYATIAINCFGKSDYEIANKVIKKLKMIEEIKYYSTNRGSELVSFKEALLQGQAPDKGLYMPTVIPEISPDIVASMKNMSYFEIAFILANEFLRNEVSENELKRITREAYDYEIPIEYIRDKIYLMRLDQGPTASFKDFAARMMARLMDHFIKKENKNLLILVATSGDTGSAAANGFYGLKNIKMVVLFPEKEVAERQRRQMTTLGGNIAALAVAAKFDDCQAMVKQAFADPELKYLNLSSANSINFGRLLPQTIYYFYAYSRLAKNNEKVVFSVPSGNFGNLTGGLIAKRMGLPVYKFIAAVNENDEFPKFLETGKYQPIKPSRNCLSSAMNVGHPSNLARLIDLYEGQMDETGKINKMPDIDLIKKDIFSVSISDEETRKTIKEVYSKYKTVLEPHGAVGFAGLERFMAKEKSSLPSVCLETAHPGKFPEELVRTLGIKVELPQSIRKTEHKTESFEIIPASYKNFKNFLTNKF